MPEQAINIADNKLSILYYVHSLDIPLTNTQVTQFFLENNIMNYFDLQQLLGQLVSSEHLICLETGHKSFYSITQKGRRTLRLFQGIYQNGFAMQLIYTQHKTLTSLKEKTRLQPSISVFPARTTRLSAGLWKMILCLLI